MNKIKHSFAEVVFHFQLCERAQSWANNLAHTNTFHYKSDKDVGQNLFCRLTNSLQTDVTGKLIGSHLLIN